MGRTLVIAKPDAVERGLSGEIIEPPRAQGPPPGRRRAAHHRPTETAQAHYAEHDGKPFFDELVAFITRSPVLVMVVEGPDDTYKVVRNLMGATNPVDAAPGTIRGDLAIEMGENLVHGSDSNESAEREIALFFPGL